MTNKSFNLNKKQKLDLTILDLNSIIRNNTKNKCPKEAIKFISTTISTNLKKKKINKNINFSYENAQIFLFIFG